MGYSLSWLAVKGKSRKVVLGELRLCSTGASDDPRKSKIAGASSEAGWYLIVAHGCEHRLIQQAVVGPLSVGCDVLTCTVEEHVMFSEAMGWHDGRRIWSVTHKGEDGPKDISEQGALPPEYPSIRDHFTARQQAEGGADADVDYLFEIPVELVRSFTGFKHDALSPDFESRGFELLESAEKSWLQRLFGK